MRGTRAVRNWARAVCAAAVLGTVAFVAPQSALACSGPVPSREEAVDAATLILTGSVVSRPGDWAYELEVEEVFRGPQIDTIVIGDDAPDTAPICSHQLEVGDRVVVALRDPMNLGLFSSAIWHLLADGTIGTIAPDPPAATHDELFTYLRKLPNTSMAANQSRGLLMAALGVALVAASIGLGVSRLARLEPAPSRSEGLR